MAYADLTTEQKTQLNDWLSIVRPMLGELGRLCNHFEIAKDAHASHISAILGELSGTDIIPNTSGLAGATSITKNQLVEILTDAIAIITANNTSAKRQLYGLFAGAINMLG